MTTRMESPPVAKAQLPEAQEPETTEPEAAQEPAVSSERAAPRGRDAKTDPSLGDEPDMTDEPDAITGLRDEIDRLDRALIEVLAERMEVSRVLGQRKAEAELPAVDPRREAGVVARAARHARELRLPEEGVRSLFWSLLALSRSAQEDGR